jgi:hypothetical protein
MFHGTLIENRMIVNNELEGTWKEVVVGLIFRHYFGIFLECLKESRNTLFRRAGLRAGI